jgi:hypothetical protein
MCWHLKMLQDDFGHHHLRWRLALLVCHLDHLQRQHYGGPLNPWLFYKIKMPAIKLLKWFWLRTKLIFRTTIGFEHGRCCIRRKKQKRTWKIVTNFWRRRSWRSSLSLDGNSRIELKLSLLSIHLSTLLVFLSDLSDVFQYKPKSFWFVFGRSII